jgi:Ser/Thr protein kinase RdoA (MazF antagonist)
MENEPMLTVDDAHQYLFERGLLPVDVAIDGELTITSAPRKNRNLRVTSDAGDLLIKQFEESLRNDAFVAREAIFYRYCAEEPAVAGTWRLLPRLISSAGNETMIIELLRDAVPLWSYYEKRTAARFPTATAAAVGCALATLHREFSEPAILADERLTEFRRGLPWIMSVHQPSPRVLSGITGANYQALRILQTEENLAKHLDSMRSLWQPSTLIHCDVKLDNVLVDDRDDDAAEGTTDIHLIDWELAQFGDPAWDVGSALHDFLAWWIYTMPHENDFETMTRGARFPVDSMQPAIRALWNSYRDERGIPRGEAARFLHRAIVFSAARLIQSAHEVGNNFNSLAAPSVLMLQLAANILGGIDHARESLFGIEQEGEAR